MSIDWRKGDGVKKQDAEVKDMQEDIGHALDDDEHASLQDMEKDVDDLGTLDVKMASGDDVSQETEGVGKDINSVVETSGAMTDMEKKKRRAERFGTDLAMSEAEKRKLRAARFNDFKNGSVTSEAVVEGRKMEPAKVSTSALIEAENAKRKARAERFGGVPKEITLEPKVSHDDVSPKSKLPQSEEAKKKARIARFAMAAK